MFLNPPPPPFFSFFGKKGFFFHTRPTLRDLTQKNFPSKKMWLTPKKKLPDSSAPPPPPRKASYAYFHNRAMLSSRFWPKLHIEGQHRDTPLVCTMGLTNGERPNPRTLVHTYKLNRETW